MNPAPSVFAYSATIPATTNTPACQRWIFTGRNLTVSGSFLRARRRGGRGADLLGIARSGPPWPALAALASRPPPVPGSGLRERAQQLGPPSPHAFVPPVTSPRAGAEGSANNPAIPAQRKRWNCRQRRQRGPPPGAA